MTEKYNTIVTEQKTIVKSTDQLEVLRARINDFAERTGMNASVEVIYGDKGVVAYKVTKQFPGIPFSEVTYLDTNGALKGAAIVSDEGESVNPGGTGNLTRSGGILYRSECGSCPEECGHLHHSGAMRAATGGKTPGYCEQVKPIDSNERRQVVVDVESGDFFLSSLERVMCGQDAEANETINVRVWMMNHLPDWAITAVAVMKKRGR